MKRKIFFLAVYLSVFSAIYADRYNFTIDEEGIVYNYEIDQLFQKSSELYPGNCKFQIENFGILETEDFPSLLQKIETFLIPNDKELGEVVYTAEYDTISCECCPSSPIQFDKEIKRKGTILPYTGKWPEENVQVIGNNSYRGNHFGKLVLIPLQYNYEKKEVYFAKKIQVTIPFISNSLRKKQIASNSPAHEKSQGSLESLITLKHSSFDNNIIKDINVVDFRETADPSAFVLPTFPETGPTTPRLLIITPNEYKEEATRFANWKCRLGYTVLIESHSTQDLLDPLYTYKIIKSNYDYYENIEHVLLFGGSNKIGSFPGEIYIIMEGKKVDYYTDFYYACLDAEYDEYDFDDPESYPEFSLDDQDRTPDVTIGRFPAMSLSEIKNMVDKTISYEMNPPIDDANYFYKSIHFTESKGTLQDEYVFPQSIEKLYDCIVNGAYNFEPEIIKLYFTPENQKSKYYYDGTPMPESVINTFKCGLSPETIINQINSGASYLLYRGHGNVGLWSHNYFKTQHLTGLNNQGKYPGIYAITCLSGMFYHPTEHSIGKRSLCESLLKLQNSGAAFAIGANRESFSGYNDYLMAGIFTAMYPGVLAGYTVPYTTNTVRSSMPAVSEIGLILQRAGDTMQSMQYESIWYGRGNKSSTYGQYNREIFHCLGDPTLKVYKYKPEIRYPQITRTNGSIKIYHNNRKLVARRKGTSNWSTFPLKSGTYYDVTELAEYFDFSLIGEGYVPIFIQSDDLISTSNSEYLKIESMSYSNDLIQIKYNSDSNKILFKTFDIYGNLIDSRNGSGGMVELRSGDNMSIVVMEKDGVVIDSRTIKNNR